MREQDRHWALFSDWCNATGRSSLPATLTSIEAFLTQVPCAPSTGRKRVQAIVAHHTAAGHQLQVGEPAAADQLWRTGELWADLPTTLAGINRWGWVSGFRGRRDSWLLVLAHAGFTRRQLLTLTPNRIDLTGWQVDGRPVGAHEVPAGCPRCAVTDWLHALGWADGRGRRSTQALLTAPTEARIHSCGQPGQAGRYWQDVAYLTPAIDQWGWVADWRPLHPRSVSHIVSLHQHRIHPGSLIPPPQQADEVWEEPARPFASNTTDEVLAILDQRTTEADRVLGRIEAMLHDMGLS